MINTTLMAMEPGAYARAIQAVDIAKAGWPVPAVRAFGMPMEPNDEDDMPGYAPYERVGPLAVLHVDGPMMWNVDLFALCCGAYHTQAIINAINAAADDETCKAVVLRVDSPGGSVAGFAQLVGAVKRCAEKKPVHAIVNEMAASMAYAMVAGADEIVTTSSGLLGSIGTLAVRYDDSKMFADMGVKAIPIASSDIKPVGNPGVPVTDEAIAMDRRIVDDAFEQFVAVVAEGRGLSADAVKATNAAVFCAKDALAYGLCDAIVDFGTYMTSLVDKYSNQQTTSPVSRTGVPSIPSLAANRITAMTPQEIREKFPDAVAEIEKAAIANHKPEPSEPAPEPAATAETLAAAFANDPAFCFNAMTSKWTMTQAQAQYIAALEAKVKTHEDEAAKRKPAAKSIDPIAGVTTQTVGTFAEACAAIKAADKCGNDVAISRAARKHPDLHAAWKADGCPKPL